LFSQRRSLGPRPLYAKFLYALPIEERGFTRYRQRSPGWAAERPTGFPPFVYRNLLEANQERPTPTPERDRDDEIARQSARQEKLERPTDLSACPSASFARGVQHLEYVSFVSRDGEQRTQRLLTRNYKPSKAHEAERFPTLKRVPLNPAVTNEYLYRSGTREQKEALRREAEFLFRRVPIKVCPPETLAAKVRKPKMGRPKVYDRPMIVAERKAVSRAMKKAQAPAPNGRRRPGTNQRGLPLPLPAPGYFIPTRGGGLIRVLGGSSRVSIPASGVVMMTPVPTPQQATTSLIGARTIPPLSEGDVAVIVLALERHARAVRAREAKRSVLAWRAARAAAQAAQA